MLVMLIVIYYTYKEEKKKVRGRYIYCAICLFLVPRFEV